MTYTIDQLIQTRFDTIANPLDNGDWSDVLTRERATEPVRRRRMPIRLALAAVAAVLAASVTAVAFGWPGRVVDFFKAPPAPESVKTFFDSHHTAFPRGVSPDATLGQPREITTATFDANNIPPKNATLHTLYVAPRTTGGFCYLWTDYGGSCADSENAAQATTDPGARPTGFTWLENDYAGFVDGWVRGDAQTVEAHFADGRTAPVPVTWVSDPIDAGFFAYVVPSAHLTPSDALTSVVARDSSGKVVGTQSFSLTNPLDENLMQTLPDGTRWSLPRRAQAAHAHEIANFSTANGGRAYLWIMPRTGGGTCFLYSTGAGGGQGCTSPYWAARLPAVNGGGANGVYFAQVKPNVATVELDYRNGDSQRLTPVDGFVLHRMTHDTGLVSVLGLGPHGRAAYRQKVG